MPIYEFHCKKCQHDSELIVSSSNWKGTKCPHCGSESLDKKLSVFAAKSENNGGMGDAASFPT